MIERLGKVTWRAVECKRSATPNVVLVRYAMPVVFPAGSEPV